MAGWEQERMKKPTPDDPGWVVARAMGIAVIYCQHTSGKRQALSLSALALLARHFHFWSTFQHFHFRHLHFWLDTFTFGTLFDTFPFQTTDLLTLSNTF